jgi:hypothetical protein
MFFDPLTFILSDYRCPHCLHSLRFRWVKSREIPVTPWRDSMTTTSCETCPVCGETIKSDWHPALIDDWMWGKRLAPGILIWIVAMLTGWHPIMLMAGTLALMIGFIMVVVYMVAERWQRPYYTKFEVTIEGDEGD